MAAREESEPAKLRKLSVVVPVYQGETTLEGLVREIDPLTCQQTTPEGVAFRVAQVTFTKDVVAAAVSWGASLRRRRTTTVRPNTPATAAPSHGETTNDEDNVVAASQTTTAASAYRSAAMKRR